MKYHSRRGSQEHFESGDEQQLKSNQMSGSGGRKTPIPTAVIDKGLSKNKVKAKKIVAPYSPADSTEFEHEKEALKSHSLHYMYNRKLAALRSAH